MTDPTPLDLDAIRARNAHGVNRVDLFALIDEVERLRATVTAVRALHPFHLDAIDGVRGDAVVWHAELEVALDGPVTS